LTFKTGSAIAIAIQNPILNMDRQSQSNPTNWITIRIEQFFNPIQQYPVYKQSFYKFTPLSIDGSTVTDKIEPHKVYTILNVLALVGPNQHT